MTPRLPAPYTHSKILQIFPIDTAKSIYQRNCLVGGREKAERPKIHFFHARMYRGRLVLLRFFQI